MNEKILGFCTFHDRVIDEFNCKVHEDDSSCEDCQHLFTDFKNPLSVKEYAIIEMISESTVRKRIKDGKINATKIFVEQGNHPKYGYEKYLIEGGELS
ncbi:MAG: hypothetical protein MIO93_10675 [ANME-2 cluster archaeon]|nr:hypothetical protein [ANME-2 cluster archaeon]